MNYIELTKQDIAIQKELIKKFQYIAAKPVKGLPPGCSLVKRMCRGVPQYYLCVPGSRKPIYLNKKSAATINSLKAHKLAISSISLLEKNIAMQQKILSGYTVYDFETLDSFLSPSYQGADLCVFNGRKTIFNKKSSSGQYFTPSENPFYKDRLIHITSFGLKVRSKSEIIIAELLYSSNLSFSYEKAVTLKDTDGKNRTIYPDFVIPLRYVTYYWEHKGMLMDETYFEHDERKMQLYHINNIFQPKNLIITSDGVEGEFDIESVKLLIQGVLLPKK